MRASRFYGVFVFTLLTALAGCATGKLSQSSDLYSEILPPVNARPGDIKAMLIVGDVELVDRYGKRTPLKLKASVGEGDTVVVGPASGALLVFSNGATIQLKQLAQLTVEKYQQQPFDETKLGTFNRLIRDPSYSNVILNLRNGQLQADVKELDTKDNSSFTVKTPIGSISVRGTTFFVDVSRDANGDVNGSTIACAAGTVVFKCSMKSCPISNLAGTGSLGLNESTFNLGNQSTLIGSGESMTFVLKQDQNGSLTGSGTANAISRQELQIQVDEIYSSINAIRTEQNLGPLTRPTLSHPVD